MGYEKLFGAHLEQYLAKTAKSAQLNKTAVQYMPGGDTRSVAYFNPYPLTIEKGQGCNLYDVDGNKYVDLLNNYTSMLHGHAHPTIMESVRAVLDKGTAYAAAIEEQNELAQLLIERVPSVQKVRFANSGTEAVLFAIRVARAFTKKTGIIKMEGGFHGTIDAVQFSIAPPYPLPEGQDPTTPIPSCLGNSPNCAKDVFIAQYNNAESVESILKAHADEIAAIILEPVLGQTGAIAGKPEFLARLRSLADEYGVLLIFDEIQSLRTGLGGVQGNLNILPDITAMGKFIGGGFPVSAFGGRENIMDTTNPKIPGFIAHSGTFNGNRVGMAAGSASVRLFDQAALDKLERQSARLQESIEASIAAHGITASVCRAGSLLHVHYVKERPINYAGTLSPFKDLTRLMHIMLLNKGVFIAPRGSMNLSTVLTDDDISFVSRAFDEVLGDMKDLF